VNETLEFLARGGPIMVVLLAASLLAATIFFERLWALRRASVVPERLRVETMRLVQAGDIAGARQLCSLDTSSLGAVLLAGLAAAGRPRAQVREAVEDRGRREAQRLEARTGFLGTVATVSPLLGLLGTVTGMISAFQAVDAAGDGAATASVLAAGIWEALLTTAAGLTVAIPAFLGYRLIISIVDRRIGDLEEASLALAEALDAPP